MRVLESKGELVRARQTAMPPRGLVENARCRAAMTG